MAHVFPEITADDVEAMSAALGAKTPYTDDGWVTACIDFDVPDIIVVCVALRNRVYDGAATREVTEAVSLLPRFHAQVARIMAGEEDDIDLMGMDIDGDEIRLRYCFREMNAQPDFFFSKACHGVPLYPDSFSPEWRTDTAVALARQIHGSQDFSAMPVLADALQDAGCDSTDVLDHCRGPHKHVWGCRVVDLVLGKE